MNVILHGATGRMGQIVAGLAAQGFADARIIAGVSPDYTEPLAENTYLKLTDIPDEVVKEAEVIVDFSNHAGTAALLEFAAAKKLPVMLATTGHTEEEKAQILKAAEDIAIFRSANMSVGIAVLADLAKKAAAAFPGADIEILEIHHNQKLDVPSGTALLLADSIKEVRPEANYIIGRHEYGKRKPEDIGIHSLRLGNEVGTHEIRIATGYETLTLKHEAENRALFGEGALRAAAFLVGKPAGIVDMHDMLAE